ncbi:hypothetical protein L228DRAFT_79656 [Xylona heveae TC161]|uniref:Uncharacterized protein n=1 Tax=Xylona heveae (strain CBS 132557 / TC161) TaxID=1328760 RepID=A0A165IZY3_XYLHT|nr:hypothetical protein L228DRAFT_79656 [Xylona heveae TC161]KZF25600.1 hypothetical protein L228DRAFT_79656 [Xylona heveae TC161]
MFYFFFLTLAFFLFFFRMTGVSGIPRFVRYRWAQKEALFLTISTYFYSIVLGSIHFSLSHGILGPYGFYEEKMTSTEHQIRRHMSL